MITNIGKLPLTNIVVNYGSSKVDKLASLLPGENAMLSPPSNDNSAVRSVTVTADHGIIVTKGYRTPIKIPGPGQSYFAMNCLCYIIWHIFMVDKLNCTVAIAEYCVDKAF
jgi:hypothetical protein